MKIARVTCCLFTLLLFLVAFAFITSAPRAHAASRNTTVFRFHGQSATANFDNTNGCIETFVFVDGSQNTVNKQTFGGADVFIGKVNNCTNTLLLDAFGSTSSSTFHINKKLLSASLSATIPVTDNVSGNTFSVSVNLTWTSTSAIVHNNSTFHLHTKGFTENFHSNADFRDAVASGTVSDGTTDFTPSPPFLAQTMSAKNFDVTITHP